MIKKNFFFSIITPTLNSEKTLYKCLESVAIQKNRNFQHIIIDGGSTDKTIKICKKFEFSNNLILKKEPIKGIYKAINEGIKSSTGEFIFLLNSDDWLPDKHTLNDIKQKINCYKLSQIYVFKSVIYDDENLVGHINFDKNYKLPLQSLPFSHGAMIVRKKFFHENFFYNENYQLSSDLDFINKLQKKDISFFENVIHCFSINGASSTKYKGIFESRKIAIIYGKNKLLCNIDFLKALIIKFFIKKFGIKNFISFKLKFFKKNIWT